MRLLLFFIITLFISNHCFTQTHFGDQWMIGSSFQKLDFKVQPPKIDTLAQFCEAYSLRRVMLLLSATVAALAPLLVITQMLRGAGQ